MPLLINSLYFLAILGSVTGLSSATDGTDTISHPQEGTIPSSSFESSVRTNAGKATPDDLDNYLALLAGSINPRDSSIPPPRISRVLEYASEGATEKKPTVKPPKIEKRKTTKTSKSALKPTDKTSKSTLKPTEKSISSATKSPEPTQKASSATTKSKTSESKKSHTIETSKKPETTNNKTSKGEKSSSMERSESAKNSSQSKESLSTKSPSPTSGKGTTISSSTMRTSTSKVKQCSKRNSKRAGDKDDAKCDPKKHVTSYLIDRMVPKEVVKEMECPAKFLQACAHYYSAISKANAQSSFTCESSHRAEGRIHAPKWTTAWGNQHKNKVWKAFTKASLDPDGGQHFTLNKDKKWRPEGPRCERDEWPPSYFLPSNKAVRDANPVKWRQPIRWIPKKDNGGAGRLWRGFCRNNDGNIGNGLRIRKRDGLPDDDDDDDEEGPKKKKKKFDPAKLEPQDSYNTVPFSSDQIELENSKGEKVPQKVKQNLVDLVGKAEVIEKTIDGTTHTISKWAVATYSQAVFTMVWDFPRGVPSQENNYYLKENECWPADIIPEDPGFVLLTDDPWYQTVQPEFPKAAEFKMMYNKAPSDDRIKAALEKRPDVNLKTAVKKYVYKDDFNPYNDPSQRPKRKGTDLDNSGQRPPKQQKPTKRERGAAKNMEEINLEWSTVELVDDRLMVHDTTLNTTRPLTDKEIEDEVRIVHCSDQNCHRELEDVDNDEKNILLILPPPLPTIPAVNEAEPTGIMSIIAEPITIKRSQPSPELPMVTGVIGAKREII